MTTVPNPASPCLRIRLIYTQADGFEGGSRFYLSYTGSAPTGAACVSIATGVANAWNTDIAGLVNVDWTLTGVDVIDITTSSGASGVVTVSHPGTRGGTPLPAQVSTNVEFNIARRYRGGKPRMFFPPPDTADTLNPSTFNSTFVSGMNGAVGSFFADVVTNSTPYVGSPEIVLLSYYHGFTNITNSSGRTRAVPTYKSTATLDFVESYSTKARMGSQKRRRSATTP